MTLYRDISLTATCFSGFRGRALEPESGVQRQVLLFLASTLVAAGLLVFSTWANAQDWPQWNGPTRDGLLPKGTVVKPIPKQGLELKWKQPVGYGYSGPVIANGRVFVTDYQLESGKITNNAGSRDRLTGKERILCLDAKTGMKLWTKAYDRNYALSYPGGPRATPVVVDGTIITLGAEGDLLCLSTEDGKIIWQRQLAEDYKTEKPMWGYAAVPLVIGEQLICLAGGAGSLVVSLDRKTGKEHWRALSCEEIGYCPPTLISHGGVQQLLIWSPDKISSLNPTNGLLFWEQPFKPDYKMSVAPPILRGEMLFASGEGISAMFKLSSNPPRSTLVWNGDPKISLGLSNTTAIFDGGYLYGADFQSGALVCARQEDGKRMWQSALSTTGADRPKGSSNGSAYLIKADGDNYFILSETGDFISAKLTPKGYDETGRFHAIDPTNTSSGRSVLWTFPAIANGCLYVRNDQELKCFAFDTSKQ